MHGLCTVPRQRIPTRRFLPAQQRRQRCASVCTLKSSAHVLEMTLKSNHPERAQKGPSENAIRLGYLLVALMWLTPASFFMLPMHAAYVLICVLVMNYDMSQYDMFMVLIFGAMHLFQVCRAQVFHLAEH